MCMHAYRREKFDSASASLEGEWERKCVQLPVQQKKWLLYSFNFTTIGINGTAWYERNFPCSNYMPRVCQTKKESQIPNENDSESELKWIELNRAALLRYTREYVCIGFVFFSLLHEQKKNCFFSQFHNTQMFFTQYVRDNDTFYYQCALYDLNTRITAISVFLLASVWRLLCILVERGDKMGMKTLL